MLWGGVSGPGGSAPGGGVCSGGCLVPGDVCSRGCVVPGGCLLRGGIPACTEADTSAVNRMTDACKNITLAQLRCGR